jgi:hypothetical protein
VVDKRQRKNYPFPVQSHPASIRQSQQQWFVKHSSRLTLAALKKNRTLQSEIARNGTKTVPKKSEARWNFRRKVIHAFYIYLQRVARRHGPSFLLYIQSAGTAKTRPAVARSRDLNFYAAFANCPRSIYRPPSVATRTIAKAPLLRRSCCSANSFNDARPGRT